MAGYTWEANRMKPALPVVVLLGCLYVFFSMATLGGFSGDAPMGLASYVCFARLLARHRRLSSALFNSWIPWRGVSGPHTLAWN
jgi:hypothetical protein